MNDYELHPFEEWRKYGDEDEQMAELALRADGHANQICFHASQLAEKYLKGYLIFAEKRFEKKHHLDYLLGLCEGADSSFKELTEDVAYLSEFYIETRYPGDIPEFTFDECEKGLESAKRIKGFVLKKIKEQVP